MTPRRPDPAAMIFRKSTYSGGHNNCVEVGHSDQVVAVRDSKSRDSRALTISQAAWTRFTRGITMKSGR